MSAQWTWPLHGSEAGDPVWNKPFRFSHVDAPNELTQGLYQNKVTSRLVAIQRPGHWQTTAKCSTQTEP